MDEVREAWGRYAPSFAAEGRASEERESIRRLVDMVAPREGALVLDVATGAGYTAFVFARAGAAVVGLDPTHEMLLASRDGWRERGLSGVARVVESWAEQLPFGDGTFDAVVAHRAPHQFRDPAAWIADSHRILKAGGTFGLADQSPPDGWEEWHNTLERLRDPTHETARSPRQWRALVEEAGFTDLAHVVVHQHHDVVEWFDRVDAPEEGRQACLRMLSEAPREVREAYGIASTDGRLVMRTPQCVLVARR